MIITTLIVNVVLPWTMDDGRSVDGRWTDDGRTMDGRWTDDGRTVDGTLKERCGICILN